MIPRAVAFVQEMAHQIQQIKMLVYVGFSVLILCQAGTLYILRKLWKRMKAAV